MSKILLIHRYFLPDTPPYATMLSYIAEHLSRVHDVKVLSTQPSYKSDIEIDEQPSIERVNGYTVQRLKVPKENRKNIITRLWSTVIYLIKVFYTIVKEKPDVVMVSTAPAVLSGFIVQLATRISRAKFYYHCQDIHPEIAVLSGQVKPGLSYKVLRYLDGVSCNRADKIIVISNDMKNSLIERQSSNEEKIHVVSNFSLEASDSRQVMTSEKLLPENKFNILFAGNIGKFQALDVILDLAKNCTENEKIQFNLMGTGTYLEHIKFRVQSENITNVEFFPHMPIAQARQAMKESSLCIVSLNAEIYKYAYPSKTITYLAEGTPLLCLVEDDSQLADVVNKQKIGISFSHGNIEVAKVKLLNLVSDKAAYNELCDNAKKYFSTNFQKDKILESWGNIFQEKNYE